MPVPVSIATTYQARFTIEPGSDSYEQEAVLHYTGWDPATGPLHVSAPDDTPVYALGLLYRPHQTEPPDHESLPWVSLSMDGPGLLFSIPFYTLPFVGPSQSFPLQHFHPLQRLHLGLKQSAEPESIVLRLLLQIPADIRSRFPRAFELHIHAVLEDTQA